MVHSCRISMIFPESPNNREITAELCPFTGRQHCPLEPIQNAMSFPQNS